ncbi:MAG: hypothetical protein MO853_06630 [Candidatus Protistobacter heckmanni]|nr:hypothetical protein [Candidatus Protistobacter heckmanni]
MVRRVAVTGVGIVSSIGCDASTVIGALHEGRSGLRAIGEFAKNGMQSRVGGLPDLSAAPPVERKLRRFMGDTALYAYHAMRQAVEDSGIGEARLRTPRTGVIVGLGVGSLSEFHRALEYVRLHGASRASAYIVPRTMGSTAATCLSAAFGTQGVSHSVSSACTSSAHALGRAMALIREGKQDLVFAGGAEELYLGAALMFDAMGALARRDWASV